MQRAHAQEVRTGESVRPRKLYRRDGLVAGVCAGAGDFFGVNVTFVRITFILAAFGLHGLAVLAYLGLWALIPPLPAPVDAQLAEAALPPPSKRKSLFAYLGATFAMLASVAGFVSNVESVVSCFQRWFPGPVVDVHGPPAPPPDLPAVAVQPDSERVLRDFLGVAERAEIDAESQLDVTRLNRYYAGEALEQLSRAVLALAAQREYMLSRLDRRDVSAVRISRGSAEIDMNEVWSNSLQKNWARRRTRSGIHGLELERGTALSVTSSTKARYGFQVAALHTTDWDEPVGSAPGINELFVSMCTPLEKGFGGDELCL